MRRAAQLITPLSRAVRQPALRSSSLLPSIPHAGPSTISRRHLGTALIGKAPPTDVGDLGPFSLRVNRLAVAEDTEDAEIIEFTEEEKQEIKDEVDEIFKWKAPPIYRKVKAGEPIILPLSDLSAADPVGPSESGMAITLPPELFAAPVRRDVLHQCVIWYRSTMRQGTHRTKGRSEVAYSGRKLRPQKGSGRARMGDASAPHLRGGAMAHPKRPRNYSLDLPRKVRAMGLRMALSSKLSLGTLRIVEDLNAANWAKTKQAAQALGETKSGWKWIPNPDYKAPSAASDAELVEVKEVDPMAIENQLPETAPESASEGKALAKLGAEEAEFSEAVAGAAESEAVEERVPSTTVPISETDEEVVYAHGKYVKANGYCPTDKFSILFLYPPEKPQTEVWKFARPLRNIPGVEIMSTDEAEIYHILKFRWLVMEGGCVDVLAKMKGMIAVNEDRLAAVGNPETEGAEADAHITDEAAVALAGLSVARPGSRSYNKARLLAEKQLPKGWITDRWRKIRGKKSLRKTFGTKNATFQQKLAKTAHRKIRKLGVTPTLDDVAQLVATRKSATEGPTLNIKRHRYR